MHTRLMPYSCVWVAHNDCLNFGAIRYLENHDQVRAAAREGWSLAAAHERGRVARGVTGDAVDGGCGGAGGEAGAVDVPEALLAQRADGQSERLAGFLIVL